MPEPEKVASGTFRVDRGAMLDKLAAFSLQDPSGFLMCWVRSAILSDARQVRIRSRKDGYELRFDGRAFSRAELSDPYACLFEEGAARGRRNRELAIGLLSVLARKAGKARVSIESGARGDRFRLEARSHAAEAVSAAAEGDTEETVIAARIASGLLGPPLDHVRLEYGGVPTFQPITVEADGSILHVQRPHLDGQRELGADGVRVRLRIDPAASRSRLALYACGLRAGTAEPVLDGLQARGEVDSDEFALDLSGNSIARNAAFERVLDRVAVLALRLGWQELAEARSRHTKTPPPWAPQLRLQSCRRVAADPLAPELQALRDAIFFLDANGHPIGLRAIRELLATGAAALQFESPKDREALRLVFPAGRF